MNKLILAVILLAQLCAAQVCAAQTNVRANNGTFTTSVLSPFYQGTTSALGRAGNLAAATSSNSVFFGHTNSQYVGALGANNTAGTLYLDFYAYQASGTNQHNYASSVNRPWQLLVSDTGTGFMRLQTAAPGTVDTAINFTNAIQFPIPTNATASVIYDNQTQTLTGKTLTSPAVSNPTTTGTDSGTETLTGKTLTSPAFTGTETGMSITSPAMTSPTFNTGISQGSGHKHQRFTGLCTTAAVANTTCTSVLTWTSAFADASYTVVCQGEGNTGNVAFLAQNSHVAASVTVVIGNAASASAVSFSNVDCIADHD